MSKLLFAVYILLSLNCIKFIVADVFDECDGVEDGEFVASSDSCNSYIWCSGEDSILGECDDGLYFDSESMSCDDPDQVYCPLDDFDVDPEPETTTTATTTTTTTTPAATTQTTSTTGGAYTGGGTTPPVTAPTIVRDACPATDNPNQIVLMANRQSCADFYLCYHGQAIEMHCTDHLHFNIHSGKCDFPENVQCMIDRPDANKCLPYVTDFFPHPEKCNYFYYCIRGFLTIQQCPFYYGWDIERRSCVQISQAKCFHNAKRI